LTRFKYKRSSSCQSRLAHREDQDVTDQLHEVFTEEGIEIVTSVHIAKVEGKSGEWVKLYAARDGAEILLEGTHLLVASGRAPRRQRRRIACAISFSHSWPPNRFFLSNQVFKPAV
jgi:hypothetical protein